MPSWDRFAAVVTARWSWLITVLLMAAAGALMALGGQNADATASPVPIPASAESARVSALAKGFPDGDKAPVILVASRADGAALSSADVTAVDAARQRVLAAAGTSAGPPPTMSKDGMASVVPVPIDGGLTGFQLGDTVKALRKAANDGAPGDLLLKITGGPAFGADIADSFSGANVTLLVVTAGGVALLLIVTYRSPVLWLVPLFVIAIADRTSMVLGGVVAEQTGLAADGSTTGITTGLVFGAGTNYALLLISRYREELLGTSDHRTAL